MTLSPLAREAVIFVASIAFIVGAVAITQAVGERMGIAQCCPPVCGCRSAATTQSQEPTP